MRIGTWNVEYAAGTAKNAARLRRLRDARADLWVLTETHDDLDLSATHAAVRSEQRPTGRAGARWVTIWSAFPVVRVVATSDPVRTTAAIVDAPRGPLLVYGTVMPWHSDRGASGTARGWVEHHRVVPEQAREWLALRDAHPGVVLFDPSNDDAIAAPLSRNRRQRQADVGCRSKRRQVCAHQGSMLCMLRKI
jgi:hypothetical protein